MRILSLEKAFPRPLGKFEKRNNCFVHSKVGTNKDMICFIVTFVLILMVTGVRTGGSVNWVSNPAMKKLYAIVLYNDIYVYIGTIRDLGTCTILLLSY